MKYYKLRYDYENDADYINCDRVMDGVADEYCVYFGNQMQEWPEVSFEYDSKEGDVISDYVANIYGWLIVTDRFVTALTGLVKEKDYQLLPVTLIEKHTGQRNDSCKVVNVLDVIEDAFDYDCSDYSIFEADDEKILSVRKYALKSTMLQDHDIFRLQEDMVPIFVSEKIKSMIENNVLTGFAFHQNKRKNNFPYLTDSGFEKAVSLLKLKISVSVLESIYSAKNIIVLIVSIVLLEYSGGLK